MQEQRDKAYRIYVSDAVRLISENTANFTFGGGGKYMNMRLYDILYSDMNVKEERTADEIINHVKQGLEQLGGG